MPILCCSRNLRRSSRLTLASSRRVIGKPNHAGSESDRCLRQDQEVLQAAQTRPEQPEIAPPGSNEILEAPQLGHPAGRLHVGDLEVVADVGVDVLVIVPCRQAAELLGKATAACVVVTRWAAAVAAPVTKGLDYRPQLAGAALPPHHLHPW